jgi:hypothetical protein
MPHAGKNIQQSPLIRSTHTPQSSTTRRRTFYPVITKDNSRPSLRRLIPKAPMNRPRIVSHHAPRRGIHHSGTLQRPRPPMRSEKELSASVLGRKIHQRNDYGKASRSIVPMPALVFRSWDRSHELQFASVDVRIVCRTALFFLFSEEGTHQRPNLFFDRFQHINVIFVQIRFSSMIPSQGGETPRFLSSRRAGSRPASSRMSFHLRRHALRPRHGHDVSYILRRKA